MCQSSVKQTNKQTIKKQLTGTRMEELKMQEWFGTQENEKTTVNGSSPFGGLRGEEKPARILVERPSGFPDWEACLGKSRVPGLGPWEGWPWALGESKLLW